MYTLELLKGELAITRLAPDAGMPLWLNWKAAPLVSVTRTKDELSVVSPASIVPQEEICNRGWRAFVFHGPIELEVTGVLGEVAELLAKNKIPIFVVSTHDTDYILVQHEHVSHAIATLGSTHTILVE